jgi:hypothetical protein
MTDVGKVQTRLSDRSVGGQDQVLPFLQRELSPMVNEIRARLNELIDAMVAIPSDQATVSSNSETADVSNVVVLRLANTLATTLKKITGGVQSQVITVFAENGNTTIEHDLGNNSTDLQGAVDFPMAARNTLRLQFIGQLWRELGRKT